jgi:hypothetical protein
MKWYEISRNNTKHENTINHNTLHCATSAPLSAVKCHEVPLSEIHANYWEVFDGISSRKYSNFIALDDSMSPTIPINSVTTIKSVASFSEDGIYIFSYNEITQTKYIERKGKDVFIISHNEKHKSYCVLPEILNEFNFIGRVVAVTKNV